MEESLATSDELAAAYSQLLCRTPAPAEVAASRATAESASMLRARLATSVEHLDVVSPLATLVDQRYRDWQFREPTDAERCRAVLQTRHELGGDDGVRTALRDGSIRIHLAVRPINLEVDITNKCNLRCVMCLFSTEEYLRRPRRYMSIDEFQAIADDVFAVCHRVSLSYGTEPLLHPDFERLIEILGRYRVPRNYVTTNGQLLTERIVEGMIDHGFHSLCVSIDAATAPTYERIRVGGSFERLQNNLRMLSAVKRRRGSPTPELSTAFVIRADNLHELPAFIEFSHEHGASGVNAMHMIPFARLHNRADTAFLAQRACNENLAAAHATAQKLGINLVAPRQFPLDHAAPVPVIDEARHRFDLATAANWQQTVHCAFPWHFIAIDANGNVLPCGWWYEEQPLGNVREQPLSAIFRGPAFARVRQELADRRLRRACQICPAAGMGDPAAAASFGERGN
jgi:radical SAM protein with 4Fe4S-binding SPASM domain